MDDRSSLLWNGYYFNLQTFNVQCVALMSVFDVEDYHVSESYHAFLPKHTVFVADLNQRGRGPS